MASYSYEAVDAVGSRTNGLLDVADQGEALRRIREMGLFPTKVVERHLRRLRERGAPSQVSALRRIGGMAIPGLGSRPKAKATMVFTRQLATLIEAGMPLLRGLRTLHEQAETPALKRVITELANSIESGSSMSEAVAAHPKVFNELYVNMVRAGEIGGALEITLRRLAEFMEKAQRIKGKIKAAMFYPAAVLFVATGIVVILVTFVLPRFQTVFDGLLGKDAMPHFTAFILHVSAIAKSQFPLVGVGLLLAILVLVGMLRTRSGRTIFDRLKLRMPILGPVCRKAAISRFARTLGTLLNSGVPILQALSIVKSTAGNVIVGNVISDIHDSVKQGDTIAVPLKASRVFPAMVAGMVDVGEQTGALPDMLMKIADGYDEEVDNAVSAMTSLLEPIMILFLAVVVGSIVVAMFLPLIKIMEQGFDPESRTSDM